MSLDNFEQRLRREPLRSVPPAWRADILSTASTNALSQRQTRPPAAVRPILWHWLWPHPKAWAGLAGCWVAILVLNFAAAPTAVERARAEAGAPAALAYLALLQKPPAESVTPGPEASPADRPHPTTTGGNPSAYRLPASTRLA